MWEDNSTCGGRSHDSLQQFGASARRSIALARDGGARGVPIELLDPRDGLLLRDECSSLISVPR